jgi:RNA polymerase sigma-70 factor (ECF subfamily)
MDSSPSISFEEIVKHHYHGLYLFALSLTGADADACDLTQQTFAIWAAKGRQLRDPSKVKSWLFTTLHREFLQSRRRQTRYPHVALDTATAEIPPLTPSVINTLDSATVLAKLQQVDELYQAPLALFYLEDLPYKQIAEILGVPVGTVQSRIARGKAQLAALLHAGEARHG